MLRLVKVAGVLALAAAFVAGLLWYSFLTFSPDRQKYPLRGIDVSHHQGEIDWSAVQADDVAFAYVKASEGGDHVDTRFGENLEGALEAGLPVGAYHFFTLCRSGDEQAANFLATVPNGLPLLPPAIDLEYEGNCSARPPVEDVARELAEFLEPVEARFGVPAVLYITYGFYDDYASHLPERALWTRWIAWHPADEDWLIWQYHDRGRVAGIEGDVDLNVLQGDGSTLANLVTER